MSWPPGGPKVRTGRRPTASSEKRCGWSTTADKTQRQNLPIIQVNSCFSSFSKLHNFRTVLFSARNLNVCTLVCCWLFSTNCSIVVQSHYFIDWLNNFLHCGEYNRVVAIPHFAKSLWSLSLFTRVYIIKRRIFPAYCDTMWSVTPSANNNDLGVKPRPKMQWQIAA